MAAKVRLKWWFLCSVISSGCGDPDWPPPLQKEPGAGVAGWYYGGGRSNGSGGTLNGSGGTSANAGARSDKSRGGASNSGGAPPNAGGEAGAADEAMGGYTTAGSAATARGGAGGVRSTAGGTASTAGGARTTGGTRSTGGARAMGGATSTGGVRGDGGVNTAGGMGGVGSDNAGTAGMSSGDPAALHPFFSEYLEAGYLKALEIVAQEPGSLVGCEVHVHSGSGSSLLRNVVLTESVSRSEPLLICTAELAAMQPSCQRVENLRFNGNDVVALFCAGELMDAIGQLGETTVHGWGTAETSTENRDLRRSCAVLGGDINAEDPFEPATEWAGYDITELSDLGRHCQ